MRQAFYASLLALAALPAAAKEVDQQALFTHIRKSFNTPPDLKFALKDLKPSEVPGFMAGRLELGEGPQQVQAIHISDDGRFYILGAAYRLGASKVPGLRAPEEAPGAPPPPPVQFTPDGRHMFFGPPMDLNVDPDAENLKKMRLKGVPSWGAEGAPVTIVEFSDLQCSHCKQAQDILEKELPAYKGKVRWVFKHYPLRHAHPWAYDAAIAAACGGMIKPAAAHELQSAFFRDQQSIPPKAGKDEIRRRATEYARKAGLDAARFQRCFDAQESKAAVEADIAEGDSLGVTGTPAIFVNGRRTRTYDFRELKAVIEEMLSKRR